MLERFFLFTHEHEMKKLLKTGIQIGKNTLLFNEIHNFGSNPEMITIGDHCVVTAGTQFITNPGILKADPAQDVICDSRNGDNRITIHDNCFIGIDSIIYPNVTVGPNAIIGAGSVVMTDVPPDMCVCGNPSRVSCSIYFYANSCKRSMVPDYVSKFKRRILQKHFWNIREDTST